ncbi:MAG: phosphotransferase [Burkholderiales bacterium]|nr:phosphotransferase [Burkholderiales bacterium]
MLLEDLRTVHEIFRKKSRVREALRETAGWCLPGDWYIEGPYARHSEVELPEELRQAIRGIRKRQVAREIVERILPPWRVHLRRAAMAKPERQCSIAYLSNGGNWKLFDLDNAAIWTRPLGGRDMAPEIENLRRFGAHFKIPSWGTVRDDGKLWRFDQYIGARSLAHCTEAQRIDAVAALLRQFGEFARTHSLGPDPDLTQAASATILESAPASLPARFAEKHRPALERLGSALRLAPAHGDLNAHNIFLHQGEPWIIDWDIAGRYQPFLYDILYLIFTDVALGRSDLFVAFLEGRFDDAIERALGSIGAPAPDCNRLLLLVHAYLINFHRKKRAGQRDAEAQNVNALWNPLQTYFAGIE